MVIWQSIYIVVCLFWHTIVYITNLFIANGDDHCHCHSLVQLKRVIRLLATEMIKDFFLTLVIIIIFDQTFLSDTEDQTQSDTSWSSP